MTGQILAFHQTPAMARKPVDRKMPQRPRNSDVRTPEYLTNDEIDALMAAARGIGRHGHRDATMILVRLLHGPSWLNLPRISTHEWSTIQGSLRSPTSKVIVRSSTEKDLIVAK